MIEYCHVKRNAEKTKLSLELEKVRDFNWYDKLIPLVDVMFVSKDFARNMGMLIELLLIESLNVISSHSFLFISIHFCKILR